MNKSIQGNANGIVEQAKQTVANVATEAKAGATTQLEHKIDKAKGIGVEKAETISEALRGAGEKLEGTGPLPQLAEKAAEGIENLAHYFENKTVGDLVHGLESFARREPALFLGSALAVGMIAGRFLKSSSRRTISSTEYASSGGEIDAYETFGYEGDYGSEGQYGSEGDFLPAEDLADDWETTAEQPMDFSSESEGIGVSPPAAPDAGRDFGRTTQPQGSSFGGVGVGSSSRGGTDKMPATQGPSADQPDELFGSTNKSSR